MKGLFVARQTPCRLRNRNEKSARAYCGRFIGDAENRGALFRQAGIDLSEVLEAANGAEALGALNQGTVDLILCDINMPIMDGIEFLKQLKAVNAALRSQALSPSSLPP